MGVTVPSKTYHNVMALDGNRVLMNCFFMPKYGARANDANAGWYRNGTQSENYVALWHLKATAAAHLWDTKRVGGIFSGYKLEYM